MKNLSHRDRIQAALAAVAAGGIAYEHLPRVPFGDRVDRVGAEWAGQEIAILLEAHDVDVEAVSVHLDTIHRTVSKVTDGMDINIAEKIQTVQWILGLPLMPLPTAKKVPA
jgi:hypothetical protein